MSEIVDCIAYIVRKSCWSFYVCAKFVTLRILDLLGLVFNVMACLTIVRLPCMIKLFGDMTSMEDWRSFGFLQVLIFLSDIPFMIMFLILVVFTLGFVLIPFSARIKRKNIGCDYSSEYRDDHYYSGFKLRRIVALYFFRMICDVLCIPLAIVCLCSWRCVIFLRKFKEEGYSWEDWAWRRHCFIQAVNLLVDIPCIIFGLVVMLTWRGPVLIREIKNEAEHLRTWDSCRLLVFPEFCFIFIDLVCMLLFLATILTWRGPLMIVELNQLEHKSLNKIRPVVCLQALLILVDLPCIICALFVLATVWRIPNLLRNFTKDQWKLRMTCCVESAMVFVDLACFILAAVVMVTIWRVYPLGKDVRKYWALDRKKRPWKIRKAICKHCLFLFIDIPAIILCLVFFITVFRFPKLISKLIQTGDFFTEFAITVFYQTCRLIVDFVFLCLFIVLMILRPIQAWVHLLEDAEHRQMRLLRHYIQWVPDIIQKRHQMRREMEEVFSSSLKERHKSREVQIHLSVVNNAYLQDLQWIRDKIQKHQLEEGYGHLIHVIQWWEGKRAHKMSRLYACELNFLDHPSQSLHNSNLHKYKNEMLVFESHIYKQYRNVESYTVPKVPLWSEACGLKTRTRKETQQVLIKCLPSGRFALSMLITLNLVFIYRGPTLLKKLFRHWYDRRNIVFNSTKEYFLDFVTVVRILLVVLLLFRAPFLIVDIIQDIFLKRSWKAVRETAKRYPPLLWEDLFNFFSTLLSWKTIRFAFTALLFGILMPADLFLTITKRMSSSKCLAFSGTALLYILFMGFPFVFPYYLVHKLEGSFISMAIGLFLIFLLVVLIAMVVTMIKDEENPIPTKPEPYDYVHFNWTNVHVIIFEVVELLQLLAIVFVVGDIPMMGVHSLKMVSNHLLLDFASFEIKMWITLVLFAAWFLCCGAPVIFEHVLKDLRKGTCAKHGGWTLFLSLFANTLFLTFVESFLTFVSCQYTDCLPNNHTLNLNSSDLNSCLPAVLYEDSNMKCWEGDHKAIATAGLLGLVWYSTTAIIFGTRHGDINHPNQDLKFSPVYNTFITFAKAFMIGVVVLAAASPNIVFGCLIFTNVAAVLFTFVYNQIFHHQPANSFVLKLWRPVTFLCAAIAAVAALVAQIQNKRDNPVPLVIFLGGCATILFIAVVTSIVCSRRMTPIQQTRQEFRDSMCRLEKQLVRNNHMVNSWAKRWSQWKRLTKGVREAQEDDSAIPTYPDLIIDPSPSPEDIVQSSEGTSRRSEADALPPPPPYEDLFPNSMVPYRSIPPPPPYSGEVLMPENIHMEGLEATDAQETNDPVRPQACESDGHGDHHSDGHGDGYSDTHSDGHGDSHSDGHGHGHGDSHNDGHGDSHGDGHGHGDSHGDTHSHDHGDSHGDDHGHGDNHGDGHGNSHVDGHGHGDSHGDSHDDGHGDGNGHSDSDGHGDSHADDEGDGDSHADGESQETGSSGELLHQSQQSLLECYDSTRLLEQGLSQSERCRASDYGHELERRRRRDPLLALECNGMNLLLLLERHIHYSAFSFAFIAQLPLWRASVRGSNWVGLLHCLRALEKNLSGNFNKPTLMDISLADTTVQPWILPRDPDCEKPPQFVAESRDPEVIRAQSDAERRRALEEIASVGQYGPQWAELLDKVLPTKPVFRKWTWDESTGSFDIHLRRCIQGVVTEVGPSGIKLARGAIIALPKHLQGTLGGRITFAKGREPKGKKGPVSVAVTEAELVELNGLLYLRSQGKKIAYDKLLDSVKTVTWK